MAASAAALLFLATAAPVLAQDHGDRGYNNDRDNGWYQHGDRDRQYRDRDNRDRDRYNRDYYRDRSGHEWHQGDEWHGHRLTYYNGRWGYWEPRNGSRFFVQFSL